MKISHSLVAAMLAVVFGVVCAAPAAAAPVGLDASYGSGGLVQVAPPLPAGLFPTTYPLIQAVFAPDSSAYASKAVRTCEFDYSTDCQHGIRLFHYRKNGALDSAFGDSGSAVLPSETELIAADAHGRALVATRDATGGGVGRLLASGLPDKSFGRGGEVGLKGFEGPISLLALAGRGRILVGAIEPLPEVEAPAERLTLFRLLPSGRLDHSFARNGRGSYALALPAVEPPPIVIDRRGSILILGVGCCENFRPVYRISARGRLDTGFDAAARGALQRLDAFAHVEPTVLVPRPGGGVDVLGFTGIFYNPTTEPAHGFELRLRADGRLDKRFGKRGVRRLPLPIVAASPGVGGGTIAVAQVVETVTVLRLLPDGAPDRAFGGGSGVQIPQLKGGVTPQPLAGGRVGVFGNGFRPCCVSPPLLARFVEASPSRPASKKGGGA